MSYSSQNVLPIGANLIRVREMVELLGYGKISDIKVPNMVGSYIWYDRDDYKSWSGVELQIYKEGREITVDTRSTASRSYWDLKHQNRTIKTLKSIFGGHFTTDAGRNRCWNHEGPPPTPLSSGCYLSRWHFHNSLIKVRIYLSVRRFEGDIARETSSGLLSFDNINPRLLSNNLIVPFVIAVWEDYFRSTFAAILKYADRRDSVLKKARLSHNQLEQIAGGSKPVEQAISECFSFQRPSIIAENFKLIDQKLDLAAAMRRPYRGRKVSLYESIEKLVEARNSLVHEGNMDLSLFDSNIQRLISDITEAVDRSYSALGNHCGFTPIRRY